MRTAERAVTLTNFKKGMPTIAVILPDLTNPFFLQIGKGIKEEAYSKGYRVIIYDMDYGSEERIVASVLLLKEKAFDGIILMTSIISEIHIKALRKQIPIVMASDIDCSDFPSVSIDNTAAAKEATDYLIQLGHRRIGFISGPCDFLSRERLEGIRQAFERHGLPMDESLIQVGDYSFDTGYERMIELLESKNRPSAVFALNDEMAIGACRACNDKGMRVPEEISIVGFDDTPLAEWMDPMLTTISPPKYEMGRYALRLLHSLIKQGTLLNKKVVFPHRLIERESTAMASTN